MSSKTYEYNKKQRTPSVTVKDTEGKTISSSNYTVKYPSGRKNVGTYKVKIVFKGNYSGTLYAKFNIVPQSTTLAKLSPSSKGFKVKWKKGDKQVSGYELQYSAGKKYYSSWSKAKLVKTK